MPFKTYPDPLIRVFVRPEMRPQLSKRPIGRARLNFKSLAISMTYKYLLRIRGGHVKQSNLQGPIVW